MRLRRTAFLGLALWGAQTGQALAYIDPGSGSLVLQLLFGGVVGALAIVKLYWHRLRDRIFGPRREAPAGRGHEGDGAS